MRKRRNASTVSPISADPRAASRPYSGGGDHGLPDRLLTVLQSRPVDELQQGSCDPSAMVTQRRELVLGEPVEPAQPGAGLRQVATIDAGHVLRRLAEALQSGPLAAGGGQQAQDRRAGEPAVATGRRERLDVTCCTPAAQRGGGDADQRTSLVNGQPLLGEIRRWRPGDRHVTGLGLTATGVPGGGAFGSRTGPLWHFAQ